MRHFSGQARHFAGQMPGVYLGVICRPLRIGSVA
jgi:hypothetical protein